MWRGKINGHAQTLRDFVRSVAQRAIASNAARDDERLRQVFLSNTLHCGHQRSNNRALKARRQILNPLRRLLPVAHGLQSGLAHILLHRRLQSAKTEIRTLVSHARNRELYRFRIAFARQSFDDWSTGITKSEQLRDFVERFACRIVARTPDDFVFPWTRHEEQIRMSA